MSRSDLRALFRSNNRDLKAVDVFADRESEWAAVTQSLSTVRALTTASGFDVEDLEAPRRNVLAFYGVGGIGKTTLSRQIVHHLTGDGEATAQWPALDPELGRAIPVRVDLAAPSGVDFESLVLSLRLAVAELGRPMPAFDLALRRYWEHNHPGEPLEEYLRSRSFFQRFASSMSLSGQVQSALADAAQALLMPGTVGSLVGSGLKATVRALRERREETRLLSACRRLPDLLEADPDQDVLSYYSHLLAWDLAQLPPQENATLVVLLDTFEDVGDRTHRDLERLIQRMVWLMPGTLFVITGRNRLQWDDEHLEGQLDWAGERHWPHLGAQTTAEPRQHRVGYLSAEDAERYLCRRLTLDERPFMEESTRRTIVARSHGLPLYLDLAVMRFLDLHARGHTPRPDDFSHDFPALVARTFRDLTAPERQVLRAVSLLDSFSVPLATAAAGLDRDAPALQLVDRPFIDTDHAAPWPYSLHGLVRAAVRDADSTSEDRWSEADWQRAAQRAFTALGSEFRQARESGDRARLVACLQQGLRLARDHALDLDWLADAAYAYVDGMIWEPVEIPRRTTACSADADGRIQPSPVGSGAAEALATTLTAVARRQRQHRELTSAALSEVLGSGSLPAHLREIAEYFRAECDRDLGRFDASMAGMRSVAEGGGRMALDASRGLLHLARRLGHFPDVQNAIDHLGTRGRRSRTLGDLWWPQGRISLSCAGYARGRDDAESAGERGEAALAQACLAFAASFGDRTRAREQIARSADLLRGVTARWADLQRQNAELLCDAGADPGLPQRAASVAAEAESTGLTSSAAYARLAECFHAAVLDDQAALGDARERLRAHVRGAEFAYLLELSYLMADDTPPEDLPRAQWLDGEDQTRARWTSCVADRRQELIGLMED
ncbi:ATP/GTP-binding protein [Streptomyces sp. bgisy100]|uniref:ATP/GTP-binding protein n=1 Tax=Streptomyces sp. bgisy100 TaxID=3413783 RepID=UPI003D75C2C0